MVTTTLKNTGYCSCWVCNITCISFTGILFNWIPVYWYRRVKYRSGIISQMWHSKRHATAISRCSDKYFRICRCTHWPRSYRFSRTNFRFINSVLVTRWISGSSNPKCKKSNGSSVIGQSNHTEAIQFHY